MVKKILLASTSEIKQEAVRKFFNEPVEIKTFNVDDLKLPPQPYADDHPSELCRFAQQRGLWVYGKAQKEDDFDSYDFIIAIENGIVGTNSRSCVQLHGRNCHIDRTDYKDFCVTWVYDIENGKERQAVGQVSFPCSLVMKEVIKSGMAPEVESCSGYNVTAGEIMQRIWLVKNSKNWMKEIYDIDRLLQIIAALSANESLKQ